MIRGQNQSDRRHARSSQHHSTNRSGTCADECDAGRGSHTWLAAAEMTAEHTVEDLRMRDGRGYRVQLCVEPGTPHSPEFLRGRIAEAFTRLSSQSRWQRFSAPIHRLSARQLDYLTDIDNRDRVAWCASVGADDSEVGIGLARYIRLQDEPEVAEFALTVVDAYQGQGVGSQLMQKLIESAAANGLRVLRGYVLRSNQRMLAICRRRGAALSTADASTIVAEIEVAAWSGGQP